MGNNDGLLVEARQNPFVYKFILIVILVLSVIALVAVAYNSIVALKKTQKWIDAHKDRPTRKVNVHILAGIAGLNFEEQSLLWSICKNFKIPNIEYLYKDIDAVVYYFNEAYKVLKENPKNQENIKTMFDIMYKLEKTQEKQFFITSTKNLNEMQDLKYKDAEGRIWELKIVKNDPQGLYLSCPPQLMEGKNKIEPLSKVIMSFTSTTGVNYLLSTRCMRYETIRDEMQLIVISHTNSLQPRQRRMTKRMSTNIHCPFYAVKTEKNKKQTKFFIQQKEYIGVLRDISSTGCCILCNLPIKKDQYIHVKFTLDGGKNTIETTGLIVRTKKAIEKDLYILHIKFEDIKLEHTNLIYATIYSFEELVDEPEKEADNEE